jgi:hypothetical protein
MPEDEPMTDAIIRIAYDLYQRTWPVVLASHRVQIGRTPMPHHALANDCIRAAEVWVKQAMDYREKHDES